ncbi:MAG: response regulator [Oligoflexia bacterium]|nr:response regulator [Oligoflexia bacterium]
MKILVIDDEIELREHMSAQLAKKGHDVVEAGSGDEALKILGNTIVDAIITDILMPGLSGIELIKDILNRLKIDVPILVITGYYSNEMADDLINLGVMAVISKPYNMDDILKRISEIGSGEIKPSKKIIYKIEDSSFLKINLEEFTSNPISAYDVYIKFSDAKYLKILNAGEELSSERINKFREKNVDYLYVKEQDHREYVQNSSALLKPELFKSGDNQKTLAERSRQIKRLDELIMEEIYSDNFDQQVFNSSVEVCKKNTELLLANDSMLELMKQIESFSDEMYRHNVGVSVLATMLARKSGWESAITLLKVNIVGLYHDVGKKWINKKILSKRIIDFTDQEHEEFESHCQHSCSILSEIPAISENILVPILQHHEYYDGTGYPSALKFQDIHPIARLITVVNDYSNLTLKNSNYELTDHEKAMEFLNKRKEKYDPRMLKNFCELFR